MTKDTMVSTLLSHAIPFPIPFDGGSDGDAGAGDQGGTPPAAGSSATALGGDANTEGKSEGETENNGAGDASDKTNSEGDKPDDKGEASEKGNKTDQDAEPFAINAPEGLENFQNDFDQFAADMDPWLKDNPNATLKEALSEAARRQANLVASGSKDAIEAYNAKVDKWAEQSKSDSVIGGNKYDENIAVAVKAIDKFGDQELIDTLNSSGLGNHPVVIRAFFQLGSQLKEAPLIKGDTASDNMSLAGALYGDEK